MTDPIDLKVGDRINVCDSDWVSFSSTGTLPNAETLIIESIREQHGRKYYTIKGKLKRTGDSEALFGFRLGRTFRHFGGNHPGVVYDPYQGATSATMVDSSQPITSTATVDTTTNTTTTSSTIPTVFVPLIKPLSSMLSDSSVSLGFSHLEFPLDTELKDLAANTALIFEFGYLNSFRETYLPHIHMIRSISDVRSTALTWGMLNGTVSIVTISESLNSGIIDPNSGEENPAFMYLLDASFHEVTSPLFVIKRAETETTESTGNILKFYGTGEQVQTLKDRRIMLEYPDAEPAVLNVTNVPAAFDSATELYPQLHAITLSEDVAYSDFTNENPPVTVFGNLANANEGKTLPETPIGSGDATLSFQNFKLPKAPLTYHIVAENTPSETPELEIYVDGRQWAQVESFFGRGKDEQVYIVREDADGNSWAAIWRRQNGCASDARRQ